MALITSDCAPSRYHSYAAADPPLLLARAGADIREGSTLFLGPGVALFGQVTPRPTAAIPMENPYCSCKLGLQLRSLWRTPAAAVSLAYSCDPYGEPLLQL